MSAREDRRTPEEKASTQWFVVATDKFMSGWGQAPGRSLFALACSTWDDAQVVRDNLLARPEMKRVRVVGGDWRPRLGEGDHLSIGGKTSAHPHYTPGFFRRKS